MATYFVASGGSNTSPYDTWAKAATSLQTAITAASTAGDIVVIQYDAVPSTDSALGSDKTYAIAANISIVSASNDGGSAYTLTEMGTANYIGNNSLGRFVRFSGSNLSLFVYGLTLIVGGTDDISLANEGMMIRWENCRFEQHSTGSYLSLGPFNSTIGVNYIEVFNCTFKFYEATDTLRIYNVNALIHNISVDTSVATPDYLFSGIGYNAEITIVASDLSALTGTGLINQPSYGRHRYKFVQCKLPSTVLASQATFTNGSNCSLEMFDCSVDDTHYHYRYETGAGSLSVDTGIYANDGAEYNAAAAKASWKLVTGSNVSYQAPFITPWISAFNESTSALTVSLEAVRSGSATKYNENELWSEWIYKGTSGSSKGTLDRTDRGGVLPSGTAQATGALDGSGWTGENATSAFMKLAPSSSITPAEIGDVAVRICFAAPSSTVYLDPQIRGL